MYQFFKLLHIVGFILGVGVTIAAFLAFKQFWKLYFANPAQGRAAFRAFGALQKFGLIGLLLVLVGGISMLAVADWSYMNLLWFQIKLGLVVLMLVNGFTFGRTAKLQLQAFLQNETATPEDGKKLQVKLRRFQILQLCIFASIILLSVFRIT